MEECPVCTATLIIVAVVLVLASIVAIYLAFSACRKDVMLVAPSPDVAVIESPSPKAAYVTPLQVVGQSYLASSHVCQPAVQHVCQPAVQHVYQPTVQHVYQPAVHHQVSIQTVPARRYTTPALPSHVCVQPTLTSGQIYLQSPSHAPILLRWSHPEDDVFHFLIDGGPANLYGWKKSSSCNKQWQATLKSARMKILATIGWLSDGVFECHRDEYVRSFARVLFGKTAPIFFRKFQNPSVLLLSGSWWTCFFLDD